MQIGGDPLPMVAESLFDLLLFEPEDKMSDSCKSLVAEQNLIMQRSVQPQDESDLLQGGVNLICKSGNGLH